MPRENEAMRGTKTVYPIYSNEVRLVWFEAIFLELSVGIPCFLLDLAELYASHSKRFDLIKVCPFLVFGVLRKEKASPAYLPNT